MLKKSDLSKQFELVVQQEIKNYNDSLGQVFQAINGLKEQLKSLEEQSLENYALVSSQQKQLEIEFQLLKKDLSSSFSSLGSHVNDQKVINERNNYKIIEISDAVERKIKIDSNVQNQLNKLNNDIFNNKSELSDALSRMHSLLDDLLLRFRKEILKAKREILEAPSEASLVRTQLEEKLAAHTVDVDGIMRELQHFKKSTYIVEKQIENIYTLIERLKGRKE